MAHEAAFETTPTMGSDNPDFSMVLGGPLFQLYRRAHLSGSALELLWRRVLVITTVAWLPLLLLSVLDGRAAGNAVRIPFLYDVEAHARFLVALPMLILAELVVHRRVSPAIRQFVERRIVPAAELPQFHAAVSATLRARNSVTLEVSLLVFVYAFGIWIWRSQAALGLPTWYATPDPGHLNLTQSGYYLAFVSIPIFQFMLLRWYARLVLWFHLLWRISRLHLRLTAAHPDRAGGIGFLGRTSYAFGPILFAQGALLAGLIASKVLYEGQNLIAFKMQAAGVIGLMVLCILGPLAMFSPMMERAQRQGLAEYGLLANRYVFGFEEKWIRRGSPDMGELLGTGDIQSLADLGNSFSVTREMRLVPFGVLDALRLAGATAAPLLPLTLTIFSLEEVLTKLFHLLI
jgi:hypothetical protein